MEIKDIERLVAGNESHNVEFKETTGQLERGMETLCAFLNGEGGTVLFGVTDKGKIVGQEVTDNTKKLTFLINHKTTTPQVPPKYPPSQNNDNHQEINDINDEHKKSTPQVPPKSTSMTPQVKKLIFAIGENTCSQREMLDILNLKDRKNFRKNYLLPAIEGGWVEPTVSNQPTSSKQKYRLTERGKQII